MKKLSVVTMSAIFVAVFAASPFAEDDGKHKVTEAQLRAAVSALQDQQQRMLDFLQGQIDRLLPVGSIIPWHKNLTATPELPEGWIECNGQILDDQESPYHGQVIPNLNGEGRFLRGSNTSGVEEGDTLASHDHDVSLNSSSVDNHSHTSSLSIGSVGNHNHGANTSIPNGGSHTHSSKTAPPLPGASGYLTGGSAFTGAGYIGNAGDHSHQATTNIDPSGNHSHSAAATIAPAGSHSHTINGKTAAKGDQETKPINMSVVYIMKVKLTYVQ